MPEMAMRFEQMRLRAGGGHRENKSSERHRLLRRWALHRGTGEGGGVAVGA